MSGDKWCSGLCGRELPAVAFDRRNGKCRACTRVERRPYYRRRSRRLYHSDKAFKARAKRLARESYARHAESRRATVAARALRLKLAA